jgi:hypothetical protein
MMLFTSFEWRNELISVSTPVDKDNHASVIQSRSIHIRKRRCSCIARYCQVLEGQHGKHSFIIKRVHDTSRLRV